MILEKDGMIVCSTIFGSTNIKEVEDWLAENNIVGVYSYQGVPDIDNKWNNKWYMEWKLTNEKDALAFKIKWGS